MASSDAAVRAPVSPGDILAGKYQVERILGVGGMGVVVAAKHLQLDERVALKFLREKVIDEPEIVVRFLREARAVAKLKSDHVVRVRDVGNLENGAPYIVMELLEGETLKERVKRDGALPIEQSVEYVLQACAAIAEAHSHGIVHRDIKPTNLFLTFRPDGRALLKVFDFGISKQLQTPADPDAELGMTATTSMLGSPLYMSPEQMVSARSVDARTDIWSLGVTLYLLISGVLPFRADTMPQVCALVLGEKPRRLDVAKPGVPRALADAVECCLEKDPNLRFGNVAELATALEPFGTEESRGASKRVSSMLRVPMPPPSGRDVMPTMGTAISAPGVLPPEHTDVSFGQASLSRAKPRGRAPIALLLFGLVAALAGGATIAVMTRSPRARVTPMANERAAAVVAPTPAADPPPAALIAAPPATHADSPAAPDAGAVLAPAPAPTSRPAIAKPKPAAPPQTAKPSAIDPGSYR